VDAFRAVHVRAEGPVAAGAMLWRYRGQLHLTAIVKATFSIAQGGAVSVVAPEELHASDRVPFRPLCDVTLVGSAHPPAVARFGLRRDEVLIDKALHAPSTVVSRPRRSPDRPAWTGRLRSRSLGGRRNERCPAMTPDPDRAWSRG
jgi:hypothetical protein